MSRIKDVHRHAMSDMVNEMNETSVNEDIMNAIRPIVLRRTAFPSLLTDFISYYLSNKMCLDYMKQQQANVKATLMYIVQNYPFDTVERSHQAASLWWLQWHQDKQIEIDEALGCIDAEFENAFDQQHPTRYHQCKAILKYLQTLKIFQDTIERFGHLVTVNTGAPNRFGNNPYTPRSLLHSSARSSEAVARQELEELQSMTAMHYVLVKHGMSMSELRAAMQNREYCAQEPHADLQTFQRMIRRSWLYTDRLRTLFTSLDEMVIHHARLREIFIRLTIGDYEAMRQDDIFAHLVHNDTVYQNLLRKNDPKETLWHRAARRCVISASMPEQGTLAALLQDLMDQNTQ